MTGAFWICLLLQCNVVQIYGIGLTWYIDEHQPDEPGDDIHYGSLTQKN